MKKKKQGTSKSTTSKNLLILNNNKEIDTTKQNKDTPPKRLSAIPRKSPRLNLVKILVEMLDDLLQEKK